jgi:uncharacterized protein (DUF1800 family)
MIITNRLKNQHLLWRVAFGPMAENAASLDRISQYELWQLLLRTSSKKPEKIGDVKNLFDGLYTGIKDIVEMEKAAKMSEEDKADKKERQKQMRRKSKEDLKTLNIQWLDEMVNSEAQLLEKMSLFWHGHFACRVINSFFQQELLHTIRTNALGNFGDLLKAVSKSAAMIQFLNNQQNRKKKPNENFAREVMELFTMGRGNYTERDVKEAARAFTGWGFNLKGEMENRKYLHDDGTKTILGKTGNFDGDDVINILLAQPQTAKHITQKIYRYLVNETPDEEKISWLSTRFYKNNYDIKSLLEDIILSDWFYNEKNIGNRIKSPVELLAGIRRFLPLELENENAQLLFQKVLGQVLFFPPNVAGWPGGRSWIDSSTLMVRLQIPRILSSNEPIRLRAKSDDDLNMGQVMNEELPEKKNQGLGRNTGGSTIEWELVNNVFANIPREQLYDAINKVLIQSGSRPSENVMLKYINSDSRENFVRTTVLNLMSTPEYQLC